MTFYENLFYSFTILFWKCLPAQMNCLTQSPDTTYGYLSEFTGTCEDIDLYATATD